MGALLGRENQHATTGREQSISTRNGFCQRKRFRFAPATPHQARETENARRMLTIHRFETVDLTENFPAKCLELTRKNYAGMGGRRSQSETISSSPIIITDLISATDGFHRPPSRDKRPFAELLNAVARQWTRVLWNYLGDYCGVAHCRVTAP